MIDTQPVTMALDDIRTLFDDDEFVGFDLGEATSVGRGAERETLEMRESRGMFHVQELEKDPSGSIVSKKSKGRPRRSEEKAMGLLFGSLGVNEPDRSDHALAVDRGKAAPIADSWSEYQSNTDELDWPGLDTKF